MKSSFSEPTRELRFSDEFVTTMWRIARGLVREHGIGLEEAYEIMERVDPKVRVVDGKVKTVSFNSYKVLELVMAHKAWKW